MITADEVKDEALTLVKNGVSTQEAVSLLLTRVDRRVPVVMAKRLLEADLADDPSGAVASALELVEEVLKQGSWAE